MVRADGAGSFKAEWISSAVQLGNARLSGAVR